MVFDSLFHRIVARIVLCAIVATPFGSLSEVAADEPVQQQLPPPAPAPIELALRLQGAMMLDLNEIAALMNKLAAAGKCRTTHYDYFEFQSDVPLVSDNGGWNTGMKASYTCNAYIDCVKSKWSDIPDVLLSSYYTSCVGVVCKIGYERDELFNTGKLVDWNEANRIRREAGLLSCEGIGLADAPIIVDNKALL